MKRLDESDHIAVMMIIGSTLALTLFWITWVLVNG